ncbi:hypothetical protein Sango_3039100 [Sesamum angolense]|uniref:DUF4283 domain-containing protein n=1 Tax=Sesamum angolense TaxID=2727404 RepID=A0AAE1W0P6_9LAMI|nr:hypothetical protein Sango_3039100 [Sesamum angolense]
MVPRNGKPQQWAIVWAGGRTSLSWKHLLVQIGRGYNRYLQLPVVSSSSVSPLGFAMEDVIEGGPWLFQGQPIVLQFWEQGMSLRRQKHTQIPVWILLRHLPMEYWTEEGLSTVASGIGTPLYMDGITKNCSRLDYARVCVMLVFSSALPKHLVLSVLLCGMPAMESEGPEATSVCKNSAPVLGKGKELILYNSYGALTIDGDDSQLAGPNICSPTVVGS